MLDIPTRVVARLAQPQTFSRRRKSECASADDLDATKNSSHILWLEPGIFELAFEQVSCNSSCMTDGISDLAGALILDIYEVVAKVYWSNIRRASAVMPEQARPLWKVPRMTSIVAHTLAKFLVPALLRKYYTCPR